MTPVRVLVDLFADQDLHAQMGNSREIIRRLGPARFHVSLFVLGEPDAILRSNKIYGSFLCPPTGNLPATKWYMRLLRNFKHNRISIGTIESQSDLRYDERSRRKLCDFRSSPCCDVIIWSSNALSAQQSLRARIWPVERVRAHKRRHTFNFRRWQELLRSPDLREKLGRAGRKHAERFDWDVITWRWERIFLELALLKRFASTA
jgi:hypothetical protein